MNKYIRLIFTVQKETHIYITEGTPVIAKLFFLEMYKCFTFTESKLPNENIQLYLKQGTEGWWNL